MSDLISRADAIEAVGEWMQKEYGYLDLNRAERLIDALSAPPSADAVQGEWGHMMIDGNKLMLALSEWWYSSFGLEETEESKAIHKVMDEVERYVDHEKSADYWTPCSERLPNELEAVNVTWINHNPPVYYQYTKDVPNADTAVYYRGVWYWWDSTICDVLGEYGEKCGAEQIDKDIEILAWMPLPKPYREDGEV